MPANPNAPFGFKYIGSVDGGSSPNFGIRTGMIASANLNKIFSGDPLKPLASGYLDVSIVVGGGAAIGGVATWFEWFSRSQNKTVRQLWWPGNGDAIGDVTCAYHAHPTSLFEVQCLLGPITQASVGLNGNFNVGAGGQQTGAGNYSSFTLDDGTPLGSGASLPFKVYRLPVEGPQASLYSTAGYDVTQAYNRVWVTINNLTA